MLRFIQGGHIKNTGSWSEFFVCFNFEYVFWGKSVGGDCEGENDEFKELKERFLYFKSISKVLKFTNSIFGLIPLKIPF